MRGLAFTGSHRTKAAGFADGRILSPLSLRLRAACRSANRAAERADCPRREAMDAQRRGFRAARRHCGYQRQAAGAVCDQLYFDREAAGREECERAGGRACAGTGTQRRNDHQKTVGQQGGFRDAGQADLTGGRRPASRYPAERRKPGFRRFNRNNI